MISPKAKLFILLHTHRLKTNQGFTMVEVVVGILLVLIFTMIAMQAMVMATAIRVRSQEVTEASRWIQKDLENLGTTANRLNYDSVNETYPSSSTLADHAARCIATTSSAGYAQLLQSSSSVGADTDLEKLSEIGNRRYTLKRVTTLSSTSPFNVLQVTYQVYRGTDTTTTSISSLYTEVIPGASLACRQTPGS